MSQALTELQESSHDSRENGLLFSFYGEAQKNMKKNENIIFEGSYNPTRKIILIDGDGSASITFQTDAGQLASVLSSLAALQGCRIKITLSQLPGGCHGSNKSKRKTKVFR